MQIGKHSPKLVNLRKAIRQGSLTPDGLLPIEGPILLKEAARSGIEIAGCAADSIVRFSEGSIL